MTAAIRAIVILLFMRIGVLLPCWILLSNALRHYKFIKQHHELRIALEGRVLVGEMIAVVAVSELSIARLCYGIC